MFRRLRNCRKDANSRSFSFSMQLIAAMVVMLAAAGALTGCAWTPIEPYGGHQASLETLYVIARGWHTEIAVPMRSITSPTASLLEKSPPQTKYLVFGWGQRAYYMARDPSILDLLRALVPGPAVMLLIPLGRPPSEYFSTDSSVFAIPVSSAGLQRLSEFLWKYLKKDSHHIPQPLEGGPYPGSRFYAANGTYSLTDTCNTWTAEALHVSGLTVRAAGVITAGQLVEQVSRLSGTRRVSRTRSAPLPVKP